MIKWRISQCIISAWLSTLFLLIGCANEVPQKELLATLEQEGLEREFRGYHAYIFPRGDIRIIDSNDNATEFMFERIFGLSRIIKITASKETPEPIVEHRARKLVAEMNRLHLIQFMSEPGYSTYYSSYQDSTYKQLIKYHPGYEDKERILIRTGSIEPDSLPYHIGFIHAADASRLPCHVSMRHHLDKVAEGWYTFRFYDSSCCIKF